MTHNRNIAAGVAAASLAAIAAGAVVAVVKYRQGHPRTADDYEALARFEEHLGAADATDDRSKRIANLWSKLKEGGGASREVMLHLLDRMKAGKLDDEGAVYLEAQLEEVQGRAAQKDV